MTAFVRYHPGGLVQSAPAGNMAERIDATTGFQKWAVDGTLVKQRPLTEEEAERITTSETESARFDNQATIMRQAQGALTANATYLAAGQPTNAQVVAQVRALTQQNNRIIRLLLSQIGDRSQLDATS